jgi:DNA-binding CsgD family transcriptional regulator
MLHENPVMARIGARGVDGERLRTEAQRLAWAVAALGRRATGGSAASVAAAVGEGPIREVRAAGVVYTLRGSIVSEGMLGREPTVLVTITAATRAPLSDAALRGRFRLTRRETEVARGIVDGLSNQELADRMGVSYFTARNHVERLLGKLGVGSRARVGPLLRDEIEC